MNSKQLFTLCLVGLGVSATPVTAEDAPKPNTEDQRGFYLGGSLGYARGKVGADEINNRMADLGYSANASVSGQNRTAWNLSLGYRWNRYIETQVGYTDLGEVRTRLTGVATDINDYLNSANQIHPRSGDGFELALLGRYPLGEDYYVYGRLGVFAVESSYQANSQSDIARRTRNETSQHIGLGLGKTMGRRWDLRLGVDRYTVEDEDIPVIGLGAIYRFNAGTQKDNH